MLQSQSDTELLLNLCKLVKTEKDTTLKILEYLSEVDLRRLWLREGYPSLFDFCVRHLKYSEGEAARRIQASRTASKFAEVKPLLQSEELSLTGLCLLAPHLTKENALPILNAAKNKSTRDVERVIREHFPDAKKTKSLVIECDKELESLLEQAKQRLSEKVPAIILKKVLKEFLKEKGNRASNVQKHTRYVPVNLREEVKKRDGFQCTYLSRNKTKCNQTANLQIDHIRPWAKGGSSHKLSNLRLLCRAHNLQKAKDDFPHSQHLARDTSLAFPK